MLTTMMITTHIHHLNLYLLMNPTEAEQFLKKQQYNYTYIMYCLYKEELEAEAIYKLALLNLIDK